LVRALGYFTHRYGKLDGLDSHSEYWLETEAQLRTDFNIAGLHVSDLPPIKRKSLMKAMFKKAGVACAPGAVIKSAAQARKFAREVGYPVISKPDIGVGAAKTYKFDQPAELDVFLNTLPPVDYYLEKYIVGEIITFDGLTDQNGDLVFYSSLKYSQGVMETVNEDRDIYYYTLREIPAEIEKAGRAIIKTYAIKARFFHFEFFVTPAGETLALEVNMRPPGGLTTDIWNYANDINIYHEWANVLLHNRFDARYARPYHCAYIGRKSKLAYKHTHKQVLARCGAALMTHEPMAGVFSAALGDYGYVVRSPDLDEIRALAEFAQMKEGEA
jgi:biotin carboxylase